MEVFSQRVLPTKVPRTVPDKIDIVPFGAQEPPGRL